MNDIDATKTAEVLNLNLNTINQYFKFIRELIFEKQQRDLSLFFGEIELDVVKRRGICFKSREATIHNFIETMFNIIGYSIIFTNINELKNKKTPLFDKRVCKK